jgi:hypothetical protein
MSRSLIFSRRIVAAGLLVGSLLPSLPSAGAAQSASEILDRALELYEQRADGIDNYTVVQSTEGIMTGMAGVTDQNHMTMYFEKTMVDGHPVFVVRNAKVDSVMRVQERAGTSRSPAETMRVMKDHARLEGSDAVAGHECWVLRVDDPAALARLQETSAAVKLESVSMCLDTEDYVPRRLILDGQTSMDGEARPVTITSLMSDYREVEGLLQAFKTEISMSGLSSSSMSPEDREKTRKQLADARAKLAEMPEAQRAMVEKMMGGQIDKMEQMLADDALTFTFVVQDVKVNAGPPERGVGGM